MNGNAPAAGAVLGGLLCGLVIGMLIWSLIGAVFLRLAVGMYNSLAGGEETESGVPTPDYGKAVMIVFVTGIVNAVVSFGLAFALQGGLVPKPGANARHDQIIQQLVSMPVSLAVLSAMLSSMLPTTFVRGMLVGLCLFMIVVMVAVVLVLAMVGIAGMAAVKGGG